MSAANTQGYSQINKDLNEDAGNKEDTKVRAGSSRRSVRLSGMSKQYQEEGLLQEDNEEMRELQDGEVRVLVK